MFVSQTESYRNGEGCYLGYAHSLHMYGTNLILFEGGVVVSGSQSQKACGHGSHVLFHARVLFGRAVSLWLLLPRGFVVVMLRQRDRQAGCTAFFQPFGDPSFFFFVSVGMRTGLLGAASFDVARCEGASLFVIIARSTVLPKASLTLSLVF